MIYLATGETTPWGTLCWSQIVLNLRTDGRRNGVQQKYRLKLTLTANLATGEKVSIIEAESGAIIVRGRSAWTSALDDETDGSPRERRRLGQVVVRRPRNAYRTDDSISRNENSPVAPSNQTAAPSPVVARLKERPPLLESDSAFENLNSVYEQTNSLHSRPESTTSMTNTIDFRLTERYLTGDSLYFGATNEESSTTKTSTPSYMDPDPLYEYFPLGIEAWMPPVDAVYRPHVAHNTSLAPDLQALVDKQDFSWTGPHTGKPSNWV